LNLLLESGASSAAFYLSICRASIAIADAPTAPDIFAIDDGDGS
jgi:hypothetical protein